MDEKVKDRQVGGDHYRRYAIQPWDIVDEYGLDFYEGNALKYLLRHKTNRVEDLEKCMHYIEKRLDVLRAEQDETVEVRWQDVLCGYKGGGDVSISVLDEDNGNIIGSMPITEPTPIIGSARITEPTPITAAGKKPPAPAGQDASGKRQKPHITLQAHTPTQAELRDVERSFLHQEMDELAAELGVSSE